LSNGVQPTGAAVSVAHPRGYVLGMTESDDNTTLDEIFEPTETAHPDRREHAKMPHPVDDDELVERTQHERDEIAADRDHAD
jgi:hypothetical protein